MIDVWLIYHLGMIHYSQWVELTYMLLGHLWKLPGAESIFQFGKKRSNLGVTMFVKLIQQQKLTC